MWCVCCVYVWCVSVVSINLIQIFPYKCTSPNCPIQIPHTNPPIQIGLAQLIVYCDQPRIQADALRLLDIPGGTLPAGTHQYHSNVRTITAKMLEKIRSAHPIGGHQVGKKVIRKRNGGRVLAINDHIYSPLCVHTSIPTPLCTNIYLNPPLLCIYLPSPLCTTPSVSYYLL